MSDWINLEQLGNIGLVNDLSDLDLPPNALTLATNCRAIGKDIVNAGGYDRHTNGDIPFNATTIFDAFNLNEHYFILCGNNKVYELFQNIWKDITGTALSNSEDPRWSGGWLQGATILSRGQYVRSYSKDLADLTTQPLLYDNASSWEDLNYKADVFRPFKNHMFAGSVYTPTYYPARVMWSAAVEYGALPSQWVAAAENDAGNIDLADTTGRIVDMKQLRNSLLIYKNSAIHKCDYIGGNFVFQFSTVSNTQGVYTRDCIGEYNNIHFVQSNEDIYWTNGETVESLLWGKMKKTWLADRDEAKAANNFTVYDPINEEMLFAYVPKGEAGEWPTKILVYNVRQKSFWFRDYGYPLGHCVAGVNRSVGTADTILIGIDTFRNLLLDLENGAEQDGVPTIASIGRDGLFAAPGHDTIQIDKVRVNLKGNDATLSLNEQAAPGANASQEESVTVAQATEYKSDIRANANIIGWKLAFSTSNPWKLSSIALLVQKSGER